MSEIPPSGVAGFGHGCAFRIITYRPSDYAQPFGKYGLPLHHPRFREWIGAPESSRLLDKGPSVWLRSLSRDVCLMTTNLNILDQYVLCLQGMASKILELTLGPGTFRLWQWLWALWLPGFAGLPFIWRPWVSGALRWIQRGAHKRSRDNSCRSITGEWLLSGPLVGTPAVN